ncbi:Ubiquitinyl hydrolase 1, variant 2 [Balamuthia mandrillaris]
MDIDTRKRLSSLISKAVRTEGNTVDPPLWKEIKGIVRQSNHNVEGAYQFLFQHLKANHAQVRLTCVLLIHELFLRSKHFRLLLVKNLKPFVELSVGPRVTHPLPPPLDVAEQLRRKGLECIEEWHEKHGAFYKELRVTFQYLHHSLKLKFPNVRAENELRLRREQERKERTQQILRVKFVQTLKELEEFEADILHNLAEMENCLELASSSHPQAPVPLLLNQATLEKKDQDEKRSVKGKEKEKEELLETSKEYKEEETYKHENKEENEDTDWMAEWVWEEGLLESHTRDTEKEDKTEDSDIESEEEILVHSNSSTFQPGTLPTIQSQGLGGSLYQLDLKVDKKLDLIDSNHVLFSTLHNSLKLINNRHLQLVTKWKDVLLRLEVSTSDEGERIDGTSTLLTHHLQQRLLQKVVDLCNRMHEVKKQCNVIGIRENTEETKGSEIEGDEEGNNDQVVEFEKVNIKEGYEKDVDTTFLVPPSRSNTTYKQSTKLQIARQQQINKTNEYIKKMNHQRQLQQTIAKETATVHENTYKPYWERPKEAQVISREIPETESREDMLKRAPIMPLQPFLLFWGKDEVELNRSGIERSHRFLGNAANGIVTTKKVDFMSMRMDIYKTPVEPVKWVCIFYLFVNSL